LIDKNDCAVKENYTSSKTIIHVNKAPCSTKKKN